MYYPQIKHTIDIFERMYNNLPPLLPEEIKNEMEHALEHLHNDYTVSIEDVENIVIAMGKKIWPYWRSFQEFVDMAQGEMGEKFLLGKISPSLKIKYKKFKECGGSYRDLRTGGPMNFFDENERTEITKVVVEVDQEIKKYVRQMSLSSDRKKYEDLIIEFQGILDGIEKRLDNLRLAAEDEAEHPRLAEEIRAQIKSFEMGLCFLGPNIKNHEICEAEEFFQERKISKKLHRFE